jgi:hypothetical protein
MNDDNIANVAKWEWDGNSNYKELLLIVAEWVFDNSGQQELARVVS